MTATPSFPASAVNAGKAPPVGAFSSFEPAATLTLTNYLSWCTYTIDGGALEVAVELLQAGLEAGEQGEAVGGETARAREASQSIDRRFEDLRRAMDARVEGIEKRVNAGQQSFADHLGRSTHILEQVGERLGRLHEASQKIEKLAGDVTRLEDLLKPPKLRGALGEMFLERRGHLLEHPLGCYDERRYDSREAMLREVTSASSMSVSRILRARTARIFSTREPPIPSCST